MSATKKTDRRTVYTKNTIKDAFLALKQTREYNAITVSELCRKAEINRGTFYLHYHNIAEVLDETLNDAFSQMRNLLEQLSGPDTTQGCGYPMCEFVRENEKYHGIFMDDSLTDHIVDKAARECGEVFVQKMQATTDLTSTQLEAILRFQMTGCLAISRHNKNCDAEQWHAVRHTIDQLLHSGLKAHYRKRDE